MKRKITFLLSALFALMLITHPISALGQTFDYTKVYTLEPANGSGNSYTGTANASIGGITWYINGNSQVQPWRLGIKNGKNTTENRAIYSATAIAANVSRFTIYHGTASSLTVNTITVTVHSSSADAASGSNPIASFSPSFVANDSIVITKQNNDSWAGKFYRINYNITATATGTCYLQFTRAMFYKTTYTLSYSSSSAGGTISVTDGEDNEVESGTALEPGTVLNIVAVANSGYVFNGWSVTGNSTIGNTSLASTTLTLGTANETLSANFVSAGSYISVNPSSVNIPCAGDVAEFEMTTSISTPSYAIKYYTSSECDEETTKPTWFGDVEFSSNTLDIEVSSNTGSARSAYFKVYSGTTYSSVVTINQAAYAPAAPTLPAAGNFDYTKEITITVPDGTTVYYTLDGTNPTSSSTEYSEPFTINATKTVKAVAYEGSYPSAVVSATYIRTYKYINEITAAGTYTVKGTVVAVYGTTGFVLGDGTGYIYDYKSSHGLSVGDKVSITSGTIKAYNHVWEFDGATTASVGTSSYTIGTPAITTLTSSIISSYSSATNLSTYFEVVGPYSSSNKEITVSGSSIPVRLSTTTDYGSLNGKTVKAKGYFLGFNKDTQYFYLCPESVEAVPVITTSVSAISNFTYNYGSGPDAKSFTVSGANLTDDITISTNSENFEISSDNSNWQTSDITISKGSGTVAATTIYVRLKSGLSSNTYNGKITVSSEDADDKEIALTGTVKHVIAYNTSLPTGCLVDSDPNGAQVAGESVSVSATAGSGYKFSAWDVYKTGESATKVTVTDNAFTMPDYNVTVSATFVPAYTVTYVANGGSGTMTDANSPYTAGTQVTLLSNTFTYAGHTFNGWSVKDASQNDVEVSDGKFTMPASNVTVTAQWNVAQYNVALSSVANVDLLASYDDETIGEGENADVDCGTEITLSATNMAAGKVFVWTITDDEDNDVTDDVLDGDILTVPAYDITIGGQIAELFFKYSGDISEGDYIIANGNYAMKNTLNSKRFNRQSISPENNQIIVADASAYLWHIASSGNYWTIYNAAEEKYAVGTGTASQIDLGGNSDDKCKFSVSGTTTYTIVNKYNTDQSVNATLRDGGSYWACYGNGTANTLYKKAVGSKHSVAIAAGITNGNPSVSPSKAYEGQTVALTANPSSGYMLDSWDVYKTGDASTKITVKNNSFVMPGYDVTVSATFRVQHTYTLVDGSTVKLEAGKHYIIASGGSGTVKVMAEQSGNYRTYVDDVTVTSSQISELDGMYEVVFSGDNTNYWTMYDVNYESFICSTNSSGNITTSPNISDNTKWTVSITDGAATINARAGSAPNFRYNSGSPRFSGYSSAQSLVYLYKKDGDTDLELHSNTSLADQTLSASNTMTVESGAVLTLTGTPSCTNASWLVIEDGGQLITNNSVKATIVRDITSASSKTVDDHWYTIASSVNAPTFASVTNLTTDGTYDLYRYDEASFTWQNSKKDIGGGVQQFTAFQNGRGYLYRKAGSEKIKYEGDVNVGNLTYTLMSYASENASVKGFNLIGNPFPHNIYKGYGGAIDESKLSDKFYYLDDNSTWQIGTYETPIKPGMGIMVQTNSTGDITIKDDNTAATAEKAPAAKSSVNEMMFTIANSQYKDAVYAVFDDGYGLYKLEHQNTEAPMAYITQNNKRYGSAMMSDDVRSFNLNFKAKTISQYTLSCKAFGEFDYVHVIDRLTGEDIDMLLEGEYNFVAAPEDMENRFIVKLGSNADNNENEVFVFQNGNDIVVNGEGELQIFDVTGRMISTQHVSGVETVSRPSQTGVYIFRIVGETVKTQKIVVE